MKSSINMHVSIDIVFCIDATESMHPYLSTLKEYPLRFYNTLLRFLQNNHRGADQIRMRIVAFRDYIADGSEAMLATDFFTFPEQAERFCKALCSLETKGGGDEPEDGLEALAFSIRSDWCRTEGKKRHVIMVFTDDATHTIGFGKNVPNYPSNMPKDFNSLTDWWNNEAIIPQTSKRLLILAPAKQYWTTICENWDKVCHVETNTIRDELENEDLNRSLAELIVRAVR